jgi:hypothetical protein
MSRRNYVGKIEANRRGIGQLRVLLIFVGIVALLLALGFVVMCFPWRHGHPPEARWQQEASKLYGGFETFREKFGTYPPNFDYKQRLAQFVKQAFPEYEPGVSTPYPESLDAAEAIVFWLTRINTNPKDPFVADLNDPEGYFKFYRFEESRVCNGRYYPHRGEEMAPFVYFPSTNYDTAEYDGFRPYIRSRENGKNAYFAAETCQIIVAGRDGKLGRGGWIAELSEEVHDNLTSFSPMLVNDIARNEQPTD